jgi:hypothetical protein
MSPRYDGSRAASHSAMQVFRDDLLICLPADEIRLHACSWFWPHDLL